MWGFIFLLSGTTIFWIYGGIHLPPSPSALSFNQAPREARLKLEILRVFSKHSNDKNQINGIARVMEGIVSQQIEPLAQLYFNLEVSGDQLEQLDIGTQFISTGVLRPMQKSSQSGFARYLLNSGVFHRFSQNASLHIICGPSPFQNFCKRQKIRFQKILNLGADGANPQARVFTAMLLGQQSALTEDQRHRFQVSEPCIYLPLADYILVLLLLRLLLV